MSSIKFSSFGAATMPLSKIVVDKDLDLRPYGVTAGYCIAPVSPTAWPTETLDWDDVPAGDWVEMFTLEHNFGTVTTKTFDLTPFQGKEVIVVAEYIRAGGGINALDISVDGAAIQSLVVNPTAHTVETISFKLPDTATELSASAKSPSGDGYGVTLSIRTTGREWGDREFDLNGKWLSLEQDFGAFTATITLNGVEMPFVDYLKYFPLAPSKIAIAGTWTYTTERPDIEVYT